MRRIQLIFTLNELSKKEEEKQSEEITRRVLRPAHAIERLGKKRAKRENNSVLTALLQIVFDLNRGRYFLRIKPSKISFFSNTISQRFPKSDATKDLHSIDTI